ncbi:sigma factor [Pirellulimonas nuda]|uniref:sigma factor n=1 Tax=Pirellulimonas nuda TaxID=2528009 RepID=UPI0011A25DEE|nr:sigma factor [Pirellulimonas nuda]
MPKPPQATQSDRSAAFVTLLAASERQLAGFVLALLPNFADADEVLQETKLRLWEQFDGYDPSQSFDAWARSVAYFQILTKRVDLRAGGQKRHAGQRRDNRKRIGRHQLQLDRAERAGVVHRPQRVGVRPRRRN